jgi:hypothetical protein
MTNGLGKSDRTVIPVKSPNNAGQPAARSPRDAESQTSHFGVRRDNPSSPSSQLGVPSGGNSHCTSKSKRHFLDFVVDGKSLWEALGKRHDMVSILCAEYSANETAKALGRLLLDQKADLPNDRRSFFVCSECGDLGCGAITAVIVAGPTSLITSSRKQRIRAQEGLRFSGNRRGGRHSCWCRGFPAEVDLLARRPDDLRECLATRQLVRL